MIPAIIKGPTLYADGYADLRLVEEQPWGDMKISYNEIFLVDKMIRLIEWQRANKVRCSEQRKSRYYKNKQLKAQQNA